MGDAKRARADAATVRCVTRKSPLALQQTHFVAGLIDAHCPGLTCEIATPQETIGDKILDRPLAAIGDKGLFTAELETSLHSGAAQIAVHSCKDLQTNLPDGLCIGAFIKRHEKEDVMCVRSDHMAKYKTLDDLPDGAVVGTSSLRRKAMLAHLHPKLRFKDIRGNIGTRLKKLDDLANGYDATVLALAGLRRMDTAEYTSRITQVLSEERYMYAVGQGCLAVECKASNAPLLEKLRSISDASTEACVRAERSLMRVLEGGCHVPIAVSCADDGGTLRLRAKVLSLDGAEMVDAEGSGAAGEADALGARVAAQLKEKGADKILAATAAAKH